MIERIIIKITNIWNIETSIIVLRKLEMELRKNGNVIMAIYNKVYCGYFSFISHSFSNKTHILINNIVLKMVNSILEIFANPFLKN